MTQQEYIDHEVKLRVHDALFTHMDYKFNQVDNKFTSLEKRLDKIQSNHKWVVGLIISGIVLPLVLQYFSK